LPLTGSRSAVPVLNTIGPGNLILLPMISAGGCFLFFFTTRFSFLIFVTVFLVALAFPFAFFFSSATLLKCFAPKLAGGFGVGTVAFLGY